MLPRICQKELVVENFLFFFSFCFCIKSWMLSGADRSSLDARPPRLHLVHRHWWRSQDRRDLKAVCTPPWVSLISRANLPPVFCLRCRDRDGHTGGHGWTGLDGISQLRGKSVVCDAETKWSDHNQIKKNKKAKKFVFGNFLFCSWGVMTHE